MADQQWHPIRKLPRDEPLFRHMLERHAGGLRVVGKLDGHGPGHTGRLADAFGALPTIATAFFS